MNRRDVVFMLGSAAVGWPLIAAAQPGLSTIGYLSNRSAAADTPLRPPFLEGLRQAGFVIGRNVAIEYRFAEGQPDRLPALAAELAGLRPAVLVAIGVAAAVAVKQATATIPIVFGVGRDPVELGLVASFSRPAGNATGVSAFSAELGPKRLELLRDLLPQPGLIAVLVDSRLQGAQMEMREVETAAQVLEQPILVLYGRSDDEIEKAFATMAERQASGLLYGASQYFQAIADKLVALATRHRIPAIYEWREFVAAGGLMSYSTNRAETDRLVGDYVGRILKGAAPADLPVVQSARFELVINLRTAEALGLTVPKSLLVRADEVIE
jgi:putative tryptophan/tyrosine transport system substrate-binding protein